MIRAGAPLLALLLAAGAEAAAPVRISVITRYPDALQAALPEFEKRYGHGLAQFTFTSEKVHCEDLTGRRIVFVHGRFWSPEMRACGEAIRQAERQGTLVGASNGSILESNWRIKQAAALAGAGAYLDAGGAANLAAFLAFLVQAARPALKLSVPPPGAAIEEGIYHPKANKLFDRLDAYLAWYRASGLVPPGAPMAGITFFGNSLRYQDVAHIGALVEALERRRIGVIPVFCWPLRKAEPFLFLGGEPQVKLLLSLNLLMMNPDNNAWLEAMRLRIINLTTTSEPYAVWKDSLRGLPPARIAVQIGTPERTGASEPILIATTEQEGGKLVPIPERIEAAADRAARWIRLATLPNHEKRLALIYYNNPPGKGTFGASYLNLMPSLVNVLTRLRDEGYRVETRIPDEEALKRLMLLSGRNVGDYAKGELDVLLSKGHANLLPLAQYEEWYRALPEEFRRRVEKVWGAPASSRMMTVRSGDKAYFVIPGIRIGNVFLGPQPLRADPDAAAGTAHDRNTPPPHSYIAAYLWYKHALGADALIHLGRHGTLEWLPGKDVAQADADPGEALVGNLPHLYFYVVDGGGEFLQVKRRSGGVIISHLTPMLVAAGVPPDQQALKDALENLARTRDTNPALAEGYLETIRDEVRRLGLDRAWGLDVNAASGEQLRQRVEEHLEDLAQQAIPLGLHAVGSPPAPHAIRGSLEHFIRNSFSKLPAGQAEEIARQWTEALLAGGEPEASGEAQAKVLDQARMWLNHVRESPSQELNSLISALNGHYLPTGVSGDPLRTPAALPTGRNLHDTDPRTFPTPTAWQLGKRMAESLIEEQRQRLGRYPEKISMVLWYGEATRHQGVAEAQALALLGVEPVWNGRGEADDVRLLSAEELKRPRVDVVLTMSGLYRDGMPEKIELLDKAVRLAASAGGDNPVQRNTRQVEKSLLARGVDADTARRAAAARIFGPAPGAFGVGIAGMVESSRDNNDQKALADLYLRNMGYAYSRELKGARVEGNLNAQLSNNEAVIHSRSTNLYGVLDNDDTFQFAGGLHAATTVASGKAPELLISNVRKAGQERFESMRGFLDRELRSRAWNPKWIEGMKASGYSGARQIAKEMEHLYGLRATAPEQVDPAVWQEMFEVYLKDKHKLGLAEFFEKENPHAQQMVAARLLEVDRQGVYRFSGADRRMLLAAYIRSVNRQGASCYVNACDNPRLARYIQTAARDLAAATPEDLAASEANVNVAKAARDLAADALARAKLVAPFDGTIVAIEPKVGEQVGIGVPVVRLADTTNFQVETTDLTEINIVNVKEGDAATVTLDAIPELELTGKVASIKGFGENKQGDIVYTVVIKLDKQDPRLRWNMTAKVTITR